MAEQRRQFTREFKLEAVRLATAGEKSLAQVARELGIRSSMLRTWKRQVENQSGLASAGVFPGHGHLPSQEEELRRLRREVEVLRQERDFLKNVWLRRRSQPRLATSSTRRDGCDKCIRLLFSEGFPLRALMESAPRALINGTGL